MIFYGSPAQNVIEVEMERKTVPQAGKQKNGMVWAVLMGCSWGVRRDDCRCHISKWIQRTRRMVLCFFS